MSTVGSNIQSLCIALHPGVGDISALMENCSLKEGENPVGNECSKLKPAVTDVGTHLIGMHSQLTVLKDRLDEKRK